MNRHFGLFVALTIVFSTAAYAQKQDYIIFPNDLVKAKKNANAQGIGVKHEMKHGRNLVVNADPEEAKKLAESLGAYYEVDHMGFGTKRPGGKNPPPPPPPPAQFTPWAITKINADAAHAVATGAGVKVCVVDTGVDIDHPDLAANILQAVTVRPSGRGKKNQAKPDDDAGHGTAVIGLIAALDNNQGIVGVAPDVSIISVKALDQNAQAPNSLLAEGIDECRIRGADVINMSWNATESLAIAEAVGRASDAGIILIAAAANNSFDLGDPAYPYPYPATLPEVVAVSATDIDDNFASFSNYGTKVELSAPGVDVDTTALGGGYRTGSGTSASAPYVAGVMALLLELDNTAGPMDILGVDIGLPPTQQGSRGRLDAIESINALLPNRAATVPEPSGLALAWAAAACLVLAASRGCGNQLTKV